MSIFSKFFGRTVSEAAGVAAGLAVAAPLRPVVQLVENETWAIHPDRPVNVSAAAAIVAEDVEKDAWGVQQASWTGFDEPTFRALLGEALNAPGVPELLTMWRRSAISDADFLHGLRKAKLEARWDTPLETLKTERLDPATTTLAIQRRVMSDPGFLIDPPPIGNSNVPPMPVSPLDTTAELTAQGFDTDRAAVETRLRGIPPAPGELLSMLNRGIINEDAFNLGVVEGDTRQEWASFLIQLRRRLLSPTEYAELDLRGWITHAERDTGAALSGMEPTDADLLFKLQGRPITVHQITTGLARGGRFDAGSAGIPVEYLRALEQGSERPEWYSLSYANRYNLPSPFVMRQLTTSKVWSEAKAAERLKWAGWIPEDADEAAKAWATAKGAAAKEATATDLLTLYEGRKATGPETLTALEALGYPADEAQTKLDVLDARRVVSAKTAAIGDLHGLYKKGGLSNAKAETALASLGVAAWAVPDIVASWQTFLTAEGGVPPV